MHSPLLRPLHTNRSHLFLYDPDMYENPVPADGESVPSRKQVAAQPPAAADAAAADDEWWAPWWEDL